MKIYQSITKGKGKKIALLVDPDKHSVASLRHIADLATKNKADYFFVGGSLLITNIENTISYLKKKTQIPVIIFPGNAIQISELADGILFLTLISGRNADLLIGQHVVSAQRIKNSGLEAIPTGYILIENGKTTSVEYMSNTRPIPFDKPEIAVATAIAGELLGLKLIYLEAGSGAANTVGLQMISEVRKNISLPIMVGGGIRSAADAREIYSAGADIIVVGSAIEVNPESIKELCSARYPD